MLMSPWLNWPVCAAGLPTPVFASVLPGMLGLNLRVLIDQISREYLQTDDRCLPYPSVSRNRNTPSLNLSEHIGSSKGEDRLDRVISSQIPMTVASWLRHLHAAHTWVFGWYFVVRQWSDVVKYCKPVCCMPSTLQTLLCSALLLPYVAP